MRLALSLAAVAFGLSACSWFDSSPPPPPPYQPAAQPQLQAQAEPAAQAPARVADECMTLVSQGLTSIRRSPQGATTDWRVQLQNRCPQQAAVLVEFWVLDRNNTAIGYEAQRVTAPASQAFEVRGTIAVPRQQSETIASTITRYGADPGQ
ncbi:MAG: hypothetical protein JNL66_21710 [Alphaproteobacteria bacterium]|nr:hypothetical protein [Alphaproteobacteria bacterium]